MILVESLRFSFPLVESINSLPDKENPFIGGSALPFLIRAYQSLSLKVYAFQIGGSLRLRKFKLLSAFFRRQNRIAKLSWHRAWRRFHFLGNCFPFLKGRTIHRAAGNSVVPLQSRS
jgi:hypothetical protein